MLRKKIREKRGSTFRGDRNARRKLAATWSSQISSERHLSAQVHIVQVFHQSLFRIHFRELVAIKFKASMAMT